MDHSKQSLFSLLTSILDPPTIPKQQPVPPASHLHHLGLLAFSLLAHLAFFTFLASYTVSYFMFNPLRTEYINSDVSKIKIFTTFFSYASGPKSGTHCFHLKSQDSYQILQNEKLRIRLKSTKKKKISMKFLNWLCSKKIIITS